MAVLLQGLFNFVYKVLTAMPIRSRTARSPLFPLALFGAVLMMPLGAAAETTSIRFQLDWRFEGPAAPFLMAAEKGYFAEEGLQVQIDSGSGSAGAVNRVASGAYEMGFGDLNALVEFLAENPEGPGIKGVYIVYDGTPAAVLRGVKAGYLGTVINCVALAWVLFAAAKIAEPFLLWNEWLPVDLLQPVVSLVESVGVPLTMGGPDDPEVWVKTANNLISLATILSVATFYSATGGLRSVVATDVVQIAIMFLGTLAFTTFVVQEVGGLGAMTDRVYETFAGGGPGGILPDQILAFTPGRAKDVTLTGLSLLGLLWLINHVSDGTGYLAQRAMACRSDRDAKTAAVVFTFTQVLVRSLLWLPLGIGLLVLFPPAPGLAPDLMQADREATYVRGMAELLPLSTRIRKVRLPGSPIASVRRLVTSVNSFFGLAISICHQS